VSEYEILFARSARRELEALDASLATHIYYKIEFLSKEPRPRGSKKLRGTARALWRMRVGDYRIIYEVSDQRRIIDIVAIRHRRDAYR
jgi:mRNA interferase RelE/StbE